MPAPDITNFFFFFFFNMSLIGPGMAKINSNELITVPAAYKEGSCRQAPSAHLPAGKTTTLENIKHHFFFFFFSFVNIYQHHLSMAHSTGSA